MIINGRCWRLQNQMVILRGVLEVKFTKYCTCAARNPGELGELSREWQGFSIICKLEPYMLKTYLGKNDLEARPENNFLSILRPKNLKSSENRSKSTKSRWKSRLGLAWRALGGGLAATWAPKAVWHGKKKPDDQKMTAYGLSFWGPFSTCSVIFQCFFAFFD